MEGTGASTRGPDPDAMQAPGDDWNPSPGTEIGAVEAHKALADLVRVFVENDRVLQHYEYQAVLHRAIENGVSPADAERIVGAVCLQFGAEIERVASVAGIHAAPVGLSDASVELAVQARGTLTFAMEQNGVPLINSVSIRNAGADPLRGAVLSVRLEPDLGPEAAFTIPDVAPGDSTTIGPLDYRLPAGRLRQVIEAEKGSLTCSVHVGASSLASVDVPIDVLAFNQWPGARCPDGLLASFVLPNHPAIGRFLKDVSIGLGAATGDDSLAGYQSRSRERVRAMVEALYRQVQKAGVSYITIPASFMDSGQKVRLPDAVLADQMGCCLDLTVFHAACLEQMGLHPLLILVQGHAFPGVWLTEDRFPEGIVEDAARIRNQVQLGNILLYDATVGLRPEHPSLDVAITQAEHIVRNDQTFHRALDVKALRDRFRPLPIRDSREGRVDWNEEPPLPIVQRSMSAPGLPEAGPAKVALRPAKAIAPEAAARFRKWQDRLLDLSLRNRLLRVSLRGVLPVDIQDLAGLEDLLAAERQFEIHPEPPEDPRDERSQDLEKARGIAAERSARRLRDMKAGILHAPIPDAELWQRARKLRDVARRDIEESGANSLYIALGLLKWIDPEGRTSLAPLLLYPVQLDQDRGRRRVLLKRLTDDPVTNVTLVEKLRREYHIEIPALANPPEDESGLDIPRILTEVRQAIQARDGWEVLDLALVGSFTFTKFLMWRDLEDHADLFLKNDVVAHIAMGTRGEALYRAETRVDPADVDNDPVVARMPFVVDADSTQMAAVASALKGRSMVLQGPPGTGKSQTITNLIAAAMSAGKSVLFVSEKLAALEVVHRRLKQVGLADFCLELHSNKANRKDVAESISAPLKRTARLPRPAWEKACDDLSDLRSRLNAYADALHLPRPLGMTVYQVGARLQDLQDAVELKIPVPNAGAMTAEDLQACQEAVADFAVHAATVEPIAAHPFASTRPGTWTAAGQERLVETLEATIDRVEAVDQAASAVGKVLRLGAPDWSTGLLADVAAVGMALSEGPIPPAASDAARWAEVAARGRDYLARQRQDDERRSRLDTRWTPDVFGPGPLELTPRFARWANAFILVAWLALWGARRRLKPVCRGPLPSNRQILADLRDAGTSNADVEWLASERRWVAGAFPGIAGAGGIDLEALEAAVARGDAVSSALVRLHARIGDAAGVVLGEALALDPDRRAAIARESGRLGKACESLAESERALVACLGMSWGDAWPSAFEDGHRTGLRTRAAAWLGGIRTFRSWCLYREAAGRLDNVGFPGVAAEHQRGAIKAAALADAFLRRILSCWLQEVCDADGVLRGFQGDAHDRMVRRFVQQDLAHVRLGRDWVVWNCEQRLPKSGMAFPEDSEAGFILRNAARQRGLMSVRTLLKQVPALLPRLKPCLLMSPLSVAQYLPADGRQFDMVVFDEASQIGTHDAIGAIARGRQVIIVGDSRQMPPTAFFQRIADDDADVQDENDVVELESVLDEALACRIPEQMLGWHYRSRHETLIDFSNQRFYGGRLHVFPAARSRVADLGVQWHPVDGVYQGSGSKERKCTNPGEARALVDHLVEKLRRARPGETSFGIVTFSLSQRELIADLLEDERARHPEIEAHFSTDLPEHVFVKNLENVQGDERDVIYFSITYAKDAHGKLRLHFGPLSITGGERRLNVAVTRARAQMHVFSSLSPEEIDLDRTSSQGARLLREFLETVRAGGARELSDSDEPAFASGLERGVFQRLQEAGQLVRTRVGRGDYRLDIAVARKEEPGVYALGVECDGPGYRTARTARDRDRLRHQVMRTLGWRLVRVWSREWWHDPSSQVRKVLRALESDEEATDGLPPPASTPAEGAETTVASRVSTGPAMAAVEPPVAPREPGESYVRAFVEFASVDLELSARGVEQRLRSRVLAVVEAEAPIHLQNVARRVLPAFGHDRIRPTMRRKVDEMVDTLARAGTLVRRGDFVWIKSQDPATWSRFRRPVPGIEVRDMDMIAPEEIAAALEWVLKNAGSAGRDDLFRTTMRLFGISRLGKNVQASLEAGLDCLATRGRIRRDGDRVVWTGLV